MKTTIALLVLSVAFSTPTSADTPDIQLEANNLPEKAVNPRVVSSGSRSQPSLEEMLANIPDEERRDMIRRGIEGNRRELREAEAQRLLEEYEHDGISQRVGRPRVMVLSPEGQSRHDQQLSELSALGYLLENSSSPL